MKNKFLKAAGILVLAAFLLHPTKALAQSCTLNSTAGGINCAGGDLPKNLSGSGSILINVVNTLIGIIGIVAVIMIIVGAFQLTLSSGNSDSVKKAKDTILFAIIGVVIALLAFAIVNLVLAKI